MASVELVSVSKAYDDTTVVSDISLQVEDGEFLVLVGPSGCGKSTCLRLIAGLESPCKGQIRIGGQDVTSLPPKSRDIGMVFQSYALYPHLTVNENLAFGLKLRKTPQAVQDEKVEGIAKLLQIGSLLHRKPSQLSGGQRQRVAMGRAMVRDPQVFLFDEPLSNLDASLRTEMRSELAALHRKNKTTSIYVTHDQVEAMTLGTRIAVLNGGVLQQVDTPTVLYEKPVNQFVAGFIGTPSMNFLEGRVKGEALVGDDFELALPAGVLSEGQQVAVGIRPQMVGCGRGALQGKIELIEITGWSVLLYCRIGAVSMVAQLPSSEATDLKVGDLIALDLAPANLFVFDDAGKTIAFPA